MSEMVERVAKVLVDRHQAFAASGYDWQFFVDGARDVFETMREPTETMRIAALNTTLPEAGEAPLYEKCWNNMIDAALK